MLLVVVSTIALKIKQEAATNQLGQPMKTCRPAPQQVMSLIMQGLTKVSITFHQKTAKTKSKSGAKMNTGDIFPLKFKFPLPPVTHSYTLYCVNCRPL